MELGKDVLALDPKGVPCAFQLKTPDGPRITLRQWREINSQLHDLVTTKLVHPSLPKSKRHRSFLVTTRGIDEEVTRAIVDMNQRWADAGHEYLRLETILGGEIHRDALNLATNLWPTELEYVKTLLEMFLLDGRGPLNHGKLAELLETTLPLAEKIKAGKSQCKRAISSAGVLCAIATCAFAKQDNFVAQIDAWVMFLAHLLAVAERFNIPAKDWAADFQIAEQAIWNLLQSLVDELRHREHLVEGDPMNDAAFRCVRITRLVGLVSLYAMWKRKREGANAFDDFALEFCGKHRQEIWLWGEGAVPLLLAFYWLWKKVDASPSIDFLLATLIDAICKFNGEQADREHAIANPYYSESEVLAERLGVAETPREEDFRRNSYCLEAIVHLFVRQNWKQEMRAFWPEITRVWFNRFEPLGKWRFFLWRTEKGTHWSVAPEFPKDWYRLRTQSAENVGRSIPATIKKHPILLALLLCVYPHRLTADVARWLDTELSMDP